MGSICNVMSLCKNTIDLLKRLNKYQLLSRLKLYSKYKLSLQLKQSSLYLHPSLDFTKNQKYPRNMKHMSYLGK